MLASLLVAGLTWVAKTTMGGDPAPAGAAPAGPSDPTYQVNLPALGKACGADWIVGGPVDRPALDAAVVPAGSALVSGGKVQIVVQGGPERTLVLHRLQAKVVERSAPATGGGRVVGEGCGGQVVTSYLTLDLDDDAPLAVPRPDADMRNNFPYTIREEDPLNLAVDLYVTDDLVRFVFLLDWSWQGERHTMTIDDHGQPFAVSSPRAAPTICHHNGPLRTLPPASEC